MKTPEEIKKGEECCRPRDKRCECPYYGEDWCSSNKNDAALALIRQLEAQAPKWIRVEERLPEVDGKYIVCTAKRIVYFTRFYAHSEGGEFQTDIYTHITHWMPLPLPPEGE